MLLCSDGIQAVSLGFVCTRDRRAKLFWWQYSWGQNGAELGFFGLDLVGLCWLEFSGFNLMEHIEAQNYQSIFYYDF